MRRRRHGLFTSRLLAWILIPAFGVLLAPCRPAEAGKQPLPQSVDQSAVRRPPGTMVVTVTDDIIRLGGGISRALPGALDAILDRHPQVRTVLLDSPGGEVLGSLSTAELIRRRGLNTMVPFNSDCASACVILLAGGVERRVAPGTKVGVHAWRYAKPVTDEVVERDASVLRAAFVKFGISGEIVDLMQSTPNQQVRWLTHQQMRDLRLITNEIPGN